MQKRISYYLGNSFNERIFYFFLILSIILGIYSRFKSLGYWPFTIDEFYIAESVSNIIKYGLPQFETGGFYTRGILYQYFSAGLILSGLKAEFALRLITVISNLAAFPVIYLLGKKISGSNVIGIISVILFSLSVWEVEFSRFARMYAPFQTIFLWYIYLFLLVVIDKKISMYKWMLFLSFISIFVYEGAIFLLGLNLLPFFLLNTSENRHNFIYSFTASLLLISGILFLIYEFRFMNVVGYLPKDVVLNLEKASTLTLPKSLLPFLANYPGWLVGFLILSIGFLYFLITLARDNFLPGKERVAYILVGFFAFFHLFGLLMVGLFMLYLIGWVGVSQLKSRHFLRITGFLLVFVLFWAGFALSSSDWYNLFKFGVNDENLFRRILMLFFNYPPVYKEIIAEFLTAVPLFTFGTILLVIAGLLADFYQNKNVTTTYRFTIFIILLLLTLVAIVNTPYSNPRYSFFIYPLGLIIIIISIFKLWDIWKVRTKFKNAMPIFTIILFMFITEDFSLDHLWRIDSKDIHLRIKYRGKSDREKIYYRRFDIKTPAEYVNERMNEEDVVLTTLRIFDYYLKRLDFVYCPYTGPQFRNYSRNHGKTELWTNANLIYKQNDLFKMIISNSRTLWIIANSEKNDNSSVEEKIFANEYKKYLKLTSIDGMVNVYKIPPYLSSTSHE